MRVSLAAALVACSGGERGSSPQGATGGGGSAPTIATGGSASGGSAANPAGSGGSSGGALGGGGDGASTPAMAGLGGQASGGSTPEPDTFFGSSRCEVAGLLLCDGFEGDAIDQQLWSIEASDGNTVELSTAQAARGQKSVRIEAHDGFGFLRNESAFPVPNNDYFGRMFVRVTRFSTVDWAHWTLAEARGTGNGSLIRVGGQYRGDQSQNRWGVGSDGGPTGDWTTHDQDPDGMPKEPPEGTWICLEWQHQGSKNATRFFVDEVEHPSLATTAQDHGGGGEYVLPQFTSVWFGWWQYQEDATPFELWIDELALDDERIGCLK